MLDYMKKAAHGPENHKPSYFVRNLNIVIGLVLIWRGIWHLLDVAEAALGANAGIAAIVGIILGIALLYVPDHDLKEIQKL